MNTRLTTFTLFSIISLVGLCVVGVSHAEIDLDTAVGIWLFDEGAGDIAGDKSIAGNDADLTKSPAWVKGKFGMALEFDGKANCVQTGKPLLDSLEEFTIVCWVNTDGLAANRIGLVGQNDSPEFGFINPTSVNLWTPLAGGLTHPWTGKDGQWHHVAAVADDKGTRVYVDGDPVEGGTPGNHGTSAFNVNIGGCGVWDGTGNHFPGSMDEVAIFHSALEDEDILTIMDGFGVMLAVQPEDKLATTWGKMKINR